MAKDKKTKMANIIPMLITNQERWSLFQLMSAMITKTPKDRRDWQLGMDALDLDEFYDSVPEGEKRPPERMLEGESVYEELTAGNVDTYLKAFDNKDGLLGGFLRYAGPLEVKLLQAKDGTYELPGMKAIGGNGEKKALPAMKDEDNAKEQSFKDTIAKSIGAAKMDEEELEG